MNAAASTQAELPCQHEVETLSTALHKLLKAHGGRLETTAQELCALLNLNLTPRALSAKLHQPGTVLDLHRARISVTYSRKRRARLITIAESTNLAPAAKKRVAVSQSRGDAKMARDSTPVSEPFIDGVWSCSWATLKELSADERQAVAHRRCGLCHTGGSVEFEKRCGADPRTLLCRGCAFNYIQKANRVMQKWKDEGDVG
jgi:hypothetical protein